MHSPDTAARFTPVELDEFSRLGFAIVRGQVAAELVREMTSATLAGLRQRIEPLELEADVHYPGSPASRDAEGGQTIRRLKEAQGRHPAFTRFLLLPAVLGRLQQLLGAPVVMPLAHHNCVMTKQPSFSSETHWHQDIRYWSFARPELVSVWLALRQETSENGCLQVIPGSHQKTFAREQYDSALFFRQDIPENQALIETRLNVTLEPGDLLFFHCRTLHAAGRNRTAHPKFSVVFTFRPHDNLPQPGSRSASLPELMLPRISE